MDINSVSETEIVQSIGQRFKSYRLHLNKTQQDIANQIGISVLTISNFENGKNTDISFKNILKLLRAISELEPIQHILPEIPLSPKMVVKMQGMSKQRSTKKRTL